MANGKEIQELDITPLLDMQSAVLEDECELDLLGLDRYIFSFHSQFDWLNSKTSMRSLWCRDPDSNASSYLVVQTPGDRHLLNQMNGSLFLLLLLLCHKRYAKLMYP